MSQLENAIQIALKAHSGQKDKAGAPYILHPLRLMMKMKTEPEQITAVLHDVVEDSGVSLDDLREAGMPDEVVEAVDRLSRRDGEAYEDFILRLKPNALARRVKLADLEDNMDLARLSRVTQKDRDRLAKYEIARAVLENRRLK